MTSQKTIVILQADDDEEDQMLTLKALQTGGSKIDVRTVTNGEALLNYLHSEDAFTENSPRPSLILLDLNMPVMDGREVLNKIKQDKLLRHIPVIILTTSKAEEEINQAYMHGANAYMTKPVKYEDYEETMAIMKKFWLETAMIPRAG